MESILSGLSNTVICGGYEELVESAAMMGSMVTRSITVDLSPLYEWCEKEYKAFDIAESDKPKMQTTVPTLEAVFDLCHKFIHATKPQFKLLATKIDEVQAEQEYSNTNIDSKIEEIKSNFINKSDLVRDDIIDIKCASSTRFIRLTAEDTINSGNIRVKIFVAGNDPQIVSITFNNNQITEYKGVDDITEAFRNQYLNIGCSDIP